jgi:transposase
MARVYSQDLRERIIDAAFSSKSVRVSAAQFGFGPATAILWMRRARKTGRQTARNTRQRIFCYVAPFFVGASGA